MQEITNMIGRLQQIGRHFPTAPKNISNYPLRIAIYGAASQTGTFLLNFIAQGRMFGPYQNLILYLIDTTE